jgi:hypothetical protein
MQIGLMAEASLALEAGILFALLLALPLGYIITLTIIGLFRYRVGRAMRETAGVRPSSENLNIGQLTPGKPQRELDLEFIRPTPKTARAARALPVLTEARRHATELARIYAAAACAYSLVLSFVFLARFDSITKQRAVLAFALFITFYFFITATPAMLALMMVLRRQFRFLVLAFCLQILALGVFLQILSSWGYDRPWPSAVSLIFASGGVPTVAVLFLNIRRLRAIGPVVFAAILLLLCGFCVGAMCAAIHTLDVVGPVKFIQQDLAQLTFLDAAQRWWDEVRRLPANEMLAKVSAFASDPYSVAQAANLERLTTSEKIFGLVIWLAGISVGIALAWAFVRWLAVSYQARRASDQMLAIDVLLVIFTAFMCAIFTDGRWILAASVLAGFAGYKLSAKLQLRFRKQGASAIAARTLLLLRVFGFSRRTQRLLEDLGRRWRYLGPIRLIGGPDVAFATIEPYEFFEFLNGRLTRAFVKGQNDLDERMRKSAAVPDPDGLFRVDDFFCHDDTWGTTAVHLARKADAVLMDLRGFTPKNRGCIFEIEQLIAFIPLRRVVLLVDDSTDLPFLETTLHATWRVMPDDSANALLSKQRLRILRASSAHRRTLDTLLGLLCESFEGQPAVAGELQAFSNFLKNRFAALEFVDSGRDVEHDFYSGLMHVSDATRLNPCTQISSSCHRHRAPQAREAEPVLGAPRMPRQFHQVALARDRIPGRTAASHSACHAASNSP